MCSPLLANIALHGMEQPVGYRWRIVKDTTCLEGTSIKQVLIEGRAKDRVPIKVIRYADDFVIMGESQEEVTIAKTKIEAFLANVG